MRCRKVEDMSKNLSELSGRKGLDDGLFDKIADASRATGTAAVEDLEKIASEFLIGTANTVGTASFYDFLKPENQGKKVYICNGSTCMLAGTQDKLRDKLSTRFKEEEIGEMCCLGRCHENSSFHYQGENYSGAAINNLEHILQKNGQPVAVANDSYNVDCLGTPILTKAYPGYGHYRELLQNLIDAGPEKLLEEIKLSVLRGRGGAGFPIHFKLEACRREDAQQKYIVCNADEGDPGAYTDRYILEQRPQALLLGMIACGFVTGADTGVLYIRAEYPEAQERIRQVIEEFSAHGLTGENILGSGFNFHFKIIRAQGSYVCGEETALLSSIEGQRPEVRVRPPYPAQKGLFNKPTIVNNVETLACLPYIMENGGEAFAQIGSGKSTGTKLVSLDSFFKNPGVYEVDMGTPLSTIVYDLGGGFRKPVKALHIGGPLGGLVPVSKIPDLKLDFESFTQNNFLVGHASVVSIPESFPMVKYLEHLFEFTAHESCGKCFPCRLGSVRGQEMLEKAQANGYKIDSKLFNDLLDTMQLTSLCALGGGLPLPVKNALEHFKDELEPYFQNKN